MGATRRIQAVVTLLVLVAFAASGAAATAGKAGSQPRHRGHTRLAVAGSSSALVSSNWAGYAVTAPAAGATFTKVVGTWSQAAATCGAGDSDSASAFWIGLGGYNTGSTALEQIGSSADCNPSGPTSYYGWYELVPAPPISFALLIRPGDVLTASVTVTGTVTTMQLRNVTRGKLAAVRLKDVAPDLSSAEWIVEAPSSCDGWTCDMVPLANFGSAGFTKTQATSAGQVGAPGDPAWTTTPIQLVTNGRQNFWGGPLEGYVTYFSTAGTCLPTALSGGSFSLAWVAAATPNC